MRKATILGIVLTLAALAAAGALYGRLPQVMPVHWGLRGQADGFLAKPWGVYIYPAMIGAMALLQIVFPALSPRRFAIANFRRAFDLILVLLMVFCAYLMAIVFASELGAPIAFGRALLGGIGALFILIGNLFGKTTKNFFIGIRTPWTLASDEVWFKTHRLGGWLFVLCGLVTLIAAIIGRFYMAAFIALGAAVLVPVVYSFALQRRIGRAEDRG